MIQNQSINQSIKRRSEMKIENNMREEVLLFVMERYRWELSHGHKNGYDHLDLIPLINAVLSGADIKPHYYADVVVDHFLSDNKHRMVLLGVITNLIYSYELLCEEDVEYETDVMSLKHMRDQVLKGEKPEGISLCYVKDALADMGIKI
jgi:hypothetical protein